MTTHRMVIGIVAAFVLWLLNACSANRPVKDIAVSTIENIADSCLVGDTVQRPGSDEFVEDGQMPEMIYYQEPVYPRQAKQAGLEGTVWVKALVGQHGDVVDAIIYKSSGTPSLEEAALAAAPKCRFNPAMRYGQPICVWVVYKVEFRLD